MGGITFSQGGQVKLCLSPLGTQLGESDDEVGWMRSIFVPLKKKKSPQNGEFSTPKMNETFILGDHLQ